MTKTIEAIFSQGILKPLEPLEGLQENVRVKLTVITEPAHPFDGFVGGLSDEDAAIMKQVIEQEFEQVNPDEWK